VAIIKSKSLGQCNINRTASVISQIKKLNFIAAFDLSIMTCQLKRIQTLGRPDLSEKPVTLA